MRAQLRATTPECDRWLLVCLLTTFAACGGGGGGAGPTSGTPGGDVAAAPPPAGSTPAPAPPPPTSQPPATPQPPAATPSPSPAPTPAAATWRALAPLALGPRQETGVAALNGEIYVVGGFDEQRRIVADVQVFDPRSNRWRRAASLPEPLHHVNLSAARGRLYVVGALREQGFFPTGITLEYDPAADRWTTRSSMPAGSERGASAVATIDDRIYVAGGLRGASVDDFSVYDPASDRWQTLPNMPTARDHFVGAAIGGVFYAIGGRNAGGLRSETESYDPRSATWSVRRPMPTARGGCMGAAVGERIIVVGGEGNRADPDGIFNSVESYEPASDSWSVLAAMRTPRHGAQAAGIDGVLYVPGGATRDGFAAVDTNESFGP